MIEITLSCPQETVCTMGIKLIIRVLSTKSLGLFVHSYHTARLSRSIGEALSFTKKQVDDLYAAGLMHDIGKINVPSTLHLKGDRLTSDEMRVMQNHSDWGANLIADIGNFRHLAGYIRHHHELPDGTGYPAQLKLGQIDALTRVLAVSDKFSAMTINRKYRTFGRYTPQAAVEELKPLIKTFFDGKGMIVEEMLQAYTSGDAVIDAHRMMDHLDIPTMFLSQ